MCNLYHIITTQDITQILVMQTANVITKLIRELLTEVIKSLKKLQMNFAFVSQLGRRSRSVSKVCCRFCAAMK